MDQAGFVESVERVQCGDLVSALSDDLGHAQRHHEARDEARRDHEPSELVTLDQLDTRTRPGSLDPNDLDAEADALLPDDGATLADARARLNLLADWHARFGLGPAFAAAALSRASVVAATCVGFGGSTSS
jgi:hypothetical protein